MASTNKTSNYELSQFLGTDKPAWLSDYNSDMSKIDIQMKANADAATAAAGSATSANTAIGTLANLTTDAKTSAVAAINEVDSHADSAQETASSALSTATSASTAASNLATYFTFSSSTNYSTNSQYQIASGGGSLSSASVSVAHNSDGSLAKIYGYIIVNNPTGGASKVKLNVDTGLRPTEKITVNGLGVLENNLSTGNTLANMNVDINTDGTIEFYGTANSSASSYIIRLFACVVFVKDFGDTPQA